MLFVFWALAMAVEIKGESLDQRYVRVPVNKSILLIIKAADAENKPDARFFEDSSLLDGKKNMTLCYLIVCPIYKTESVLLLEGNDSIALDKPLSIFKMPCSARAVPFLYNSSSAKKLLLYNAKKKIIANVDLISLRDRIGALPFFWTAKKPIYIDWDELPPEVLSNKCSKCK